MHSGRTKILICLLPKAFHVYPTFTITFHSTLFSYIYIYIYLRHFRSFNWWIFCNIKCKFTAISKVSHMHSSSFPSTNILNENIVAFLSLLNIQWSNLYLHSYARAVWVSVFSSGNSTMLHLYTQNQQSFVRLYICSSTFYFKDWIATWVNHS